MKIKGKIQNGIMDDYSKCTIELSCGKISLYARGNENYFNIKQPKDKRVFEFDNVKHDNYFPVGSTNVFRYVDEEKNNKNVYVSLNCIKRICVNWKLKKYLIQSREIKIDTIKYVIGAIIGSLLTLAASILGKN